MANDTDDDGDRNEDDSPDHANPQHQFSRTLWHSASYWPNVRPAGWPGAVSLGINHSSTSDGVR